MADPSRLHPTAEEICCPLQADVQGSWRCWAKDEGWTSKMAAAFSNMAGWESPINEALMGKTWITSDVQLPCLITVPESRSENDEKPLEVWAIPVLFTAKYRDPSKVDVEVTAHRRFLIHFQVGVSTWLSHIIVQSTVEIFHCHVAWPEDNYTSHLCQLSATQVFSKDTRHCWLHSYTSHIIYPIIKPVRCLVSCPTNRFPTSIFLSLTKKTNIHL